MTQTTQCPACQTRFKVSDTQLAAARGFVRCGRCAHIFNAIEHRVATTPATATPPKPAPAPAPAVDIDDFELEVPDFDPNATALSATAASDYPPEFGPEDTGAPSKEDVAAFQQALNEALHSSPVSTPIDNPFDVASTAADKAAEGADEDEVPAIFDTRRTATRTEHDETAPAAAEEEPLSPIEADAAMRIVPEAAPATEASLYGTNDDGTRKPRSALRTILILFASVLALIALAVQLIYTNRTLIAAQAPDMRPALERLCKKFGCTVPYPTDQEYIRTEWSELSFVPEHANLVQLSATLKNHAPYPQSYPMLEVTLKDGDNQVLIRKVFTPREYLKPESQKLTNFAANGEEKIIMRFDVGQVHAQGYSLYWFYP
jgi:predicted Zn finger-like uncharacterized protein